MAHSTGPLQPLLMRSNYVRLLPVQSRIIRIVLCNALLNCTNCTFAGRSDILDQAQQHTQQLFGRQSLVERYWFYQSLEDTYKKGN